MVKRLQLLISIPSVNGSHPEKPLGLCFVAHTVGVGESLQWTHPPFSGTIDKDKLYGRGAIDNKGGLIFALRALHELKTLNPNKNHRLYCVPDEESGALGHLGILFLKSQGELQAPAALYTYAGMEKLIIGHRGLERWVVSIMGESAHSGSLAWQQGQKGKNALECLCEAVVNIKNFLHIFGEDLFSPYREVITVLKIEGGQMQGQIPHHALLGLEIRTLPNTQNKNSSITDAVIQILKSTAQKYNCTYKIQYEVQ